MPTPVAQLGRSWSSPANHSSIIWPKRRASGPFAAPVTAGFGPGVVGSAQTAATPDTLRANRYYRQGLAFYGEGRYVEALRQFQNATFFDSEGSEVRFAQGLCLLKLAEPEKARDQFERALAE